MNILKGPVKPILRSQIPLTAPRSEHRPPQYVGLGNKLCPSYIYDKLSVLSLRYLKEIFHTYKKLPPYMKKVISNKSYCVWDTA